MNKLEKTAVRMPRFSVVIALPEYCSVDSKEGTKIREAIDNLKKSAKTGKPENVLDSWLSTVNMVLNGIQMLGEHKCTDEPCYHCDEFNQFIDEGVKKQYDKLKQTSDEGNEIINKYLIYGGKTNINVPIPELNLSKYAFVSNEEYSKSYIEKMYQEVNALEKAFESDSLVEKRDEWINVLTLILNGLQLIDIPSKYANNPEKFIKNKVEEYKKRIKGNKHNTWYNELLGNNNLDKSQHVREFTIVIAR